MRYLWLPTQSAYYNLAAEEYLLTQTEDDVFMLWQNADAVIVGRHQNTLGEINREFVEQNGIIVARRLTGGGAVFHDLGNLNFTFIQNIQPQDKEINFVKYLQPVVDALKSLGIPASFSGRNDLMIHDKKISGNAMTFSGNRVLEHGCMLFSTQHNNLVSALKVDPDKFKDKAVRSVRSRVTNIAEHLPIAMSVLEFKDYLMNYIMREQPGVVVDHLTMAEDAAVRQLAETKYATWTWNFGNSPHYSISQKIRTAGGTVQVMIDVKNGHIAALQFFGDFFSRKNPDELAAVLVGLPYAREVIENALQTIDVSDYFNNVQNEEIISLLI